MPVVFVHGAPDTAEVWDRVRRELDDVETIALSLPGFGCDAPAGFGATRWDYADWLVGRLAAFGEPVDVVGHDQGATILHGVLQERPELVRSWVLSDGVCDVDMGWHAQARMWQTTRVGEASCAAWLALGTDARVAALVAGGVPEHWARRVADRIDERMLRCILALYRSEPYTGDWQLDPERSYPPGLVMWGTRDPFGPPELGRRAAERAWVDFVELDCGHWWPVEQPTEGARALRAFWADLAHVAVRPR
jgi:pimeloyl-ACP methyl ester carboxylesterase